MRNSRYHLRQKRNQMRNQLATNNCNSFCLSPVVIHDKSPNRVNIDFREKRISIVFKTIYVFAVFFAALFIDMASRTVDGMDITFLIEACLTSFFAVEMWHMVSYVFNEMKCMKAAPCDKQVKLTEESYSRIFSSFIGSAIIALWDCFLLYHYRDRFDSTLLVHIITYTCVIKATTHLVAGVNHWLTKLLSDYVGPGLITIALSAFFLLIGYTSSI